MKMKEQSLSVAVTNRKGQWWSASLRISEIDSFLWLIESEHPENTPENLSFEVRDPRGKLVCIKPFGYQSLMFSGGWRKLYDRLLKGLDLRRDIYREERIKNLKGSPCYSTLN